jgi:hypothetical protein
MRKIVVWTAAAILAAGASVNPASAQQKLKVGFIYLGPVGDFGWTYQHEVGRQYVVKTLATQTQAAIAGGTLHPFKCPVVDQDGKTVECKGGAHLDDGQILGMNFYVKGIDDKIPGK